MAAFLLVVIAAWAEMTMAPMFAMHAGHMRTGHEMAADMPASVSGHHHAGHHHTAQPQAAQVRHERHQAEHQQTMAKGPPCCPGLRKMDPVAALELVSGVPACDDPDSCCFRQGPQSVPARVRDLRSDDQRLARAMAPAQVIAVNPPREARARTLRDCALALGPPPDVFGMTLRV